MSGELDLGALADVRRVDDGSRPTLIFVRHSTHPPEKVWVALTDPEGLAAWAPFVPDRSLDDPGPVQAKEFSWDDLHEAYARVLGGHVSTDVRP